MNKFNTDKIFAVSGEEQFAQLALEIFRFQYENNKVYQRFVNSLKKEPKNIVHYTQIPFLPIEFFKTQEVICGERNAEDLVFKSSSTTSQIPSQHIVKDNSIYKKSFTKAFELFYGKPKNMAIVALLPGYLERGDSSLVYMFEELVKMSEHSKSGFFLSNNKELLKCLEDLNMSGQRTLLVGVSYALLDLIETGIKLKDNFTVMETGGMKGKRKEMLKVELHNVLKTGLSVKEIHSEYGMTELLSQAYSKENGVFYCPSWMRVLIRDTNDPLSYVKENSRGGINVIDLANIYSCSFIATQDLGKGLKNGGFEVLGRFDNSDIRGCNLMVE